MRQSLVDELIALENGWAGPGTRAPSRDNLANFVRIYKLFLLDVDDPEIELDPEDGTIHLYWCDSHSKSSFSLAFSSKTNLIGTMARMDGKSYAPWRLPVLNTVAIREKLNESIVKNMLCQKEFA